jgi:hypothetical protein
MSATISPMCSVARGYTSAGRMPRVSRSAKKASVMGRVTPPMACPVAAASAMILSSTSVRFMTNVTSKPFHSR